jgi:hypothetical protein
MPNTNDNTQHSAPATERAQLCSHCGANPCYFICPNSPHYYSPEQERADDAWYGGDDVSERYASMRDER